MSEISDPIFARIARRYDLMNRVLSLGREQAWRRSGIARLPEGRVLDLGSGTGAADAVLGERQVVALDPVIEMLDLSPIHHRVVGVGEELPFADATFDGVFSAYVFRNLSSLRATLTEVHRVLRPGGRLVVVDLGRPPAPLAAKLHRGLSSVVLPLAGAAIGARDEYRYLHRSLDKYPAPSELFSGHDLALAETWRMGPLGFVYGAVLTKSSDAPGSLG